MVHGVHGVCVCVWYMSVWVWLIHGHGVWYMIHGHGRYMVMYGMVYGTCVWS